jgi:hypothetical protein
MPFRPINVAELPVTHHPRTPQVVDVHEWRPNDRDRYNICGLDALVTCKHHQSPTSEATSRCWFSSSTSSRFSQRTPTDTTLSDFWHFDPRLLTQFLNRRLPFFLFRMFHHIDSDKEDREVVVMRQKMSKGVHMIKVFQLPRINHTSY